MARMRILPGDWDVMMMLKHEKYTSLDALGAKAAQAYVEHLGSTEAADEAIAKRDQWREVVKIRLVQETFLEGRLW